MSVSEEDLAAFKSWAQSRGYSRSTVMGLARHIRQAARAGTLDPEEVDALFPQHHAEYRGDIRQGLKRFAEYRAAVAPVLQTVEREAVAWSGDAATRSAAT